MEILSGSLIYNIVKDIAKFRGKFLLTGEDATKSNLENHIVWAEGWSRHIQMFGMTKAMPVDQHAITLSISDRPRKFSSPASERTARTWFSEDDVLSSHCNYVILGDPGCGKTTLCKRLTRSMILSDAGERVEVLEAPLIVLGRDLHSEFTIVAKLAQILGVQFKEFDDAKHREDLLHINDREEFNRLIRSAKARWLENVHSKAKMLLVKALSRGGFTLIIDGVDEINSNYQVAFEHDLAEIISACPNLKVLCTCRAGDWTRSIVTADLLSIEPLNDDELREIVEIWADRPTEFLSAIRNVPYREVLDRPLFLTLLLIIFNQGYALPDCPADVYERITSLLIERWDRERDVQRESKFSGFLSEKKLRFLSNIAFDLTFDYNQKRFSSSSLQNIYPRLAQRFRLPISEFSNVIQEIESHTGIIVESGFDHYEFCHLTVQEFLAAKHLVGLANAGKIIELLDESPATVAVATSVSSDPSNFLGQLLDVFCDVQARKVTQGRTDGYDNFLTYVSRLRLELPEFSENNKLAIGVIRLWCIATRLAELEAEVATAVAEAAIALSRIDGVRISIDTVVDRPGVQQRPTERGMMNIRTMGKDYRFARSFFTAIGRS